MVVLGLFIITYRAQNRPKVSYSSQFHFPNQNRICIPSYTRNQTPPKLSWQTSRAPPSYKYTHPTLSSLNLLSHLSLFASLCFALLSPIANTMAHKGESSDPWVNSLSSQFVTGFFRTLISRIQCLILVWFGLVWWLWLFFLQEIGEEGLFDGDSGEEEVAESACRWWGGQRRQLRCRFAPWHHGKAPAFPWRHDSYQGIRFNLGIYAFCGCLFVFIAKFCSWSLGLWIVVCVVRFGCGILEFCFVGLVW